MEYVSSEVHSGSPASLVCCVWRLEFGHGQQATVYTKVPSHFYRWDQALELPSLCLLASSGTTLDSQVSLARQSHPTAPDPAPALKGGDPTHRGGRARAGSRTIYRFVTWVYRFARAGSRTSRGLRRYARMFYVKKYFLPTSGECNSKL